ncbi:hypothetical protein C8R48DRAFT_544613, partial [Suillus tomentosus]
FFDNITHAIEAAKYLWSRLPREYQDKVKWFNADMTTYFKTDEVKSFEDGDTWGFCTTKSFGMANMQHSYKLTLVQGIDIPDVSIVIQWCATWRSLSTLWQRFGCAVQNMSLEGTAILFAEKEHFDEYKTMKEKRK